MLIDFVEQWFSHYQSSSLECVFYAEESRQDDMNVYESSTTFQVKPQSQKETSSEGFLGKHTLSVICLIPFALNVLADEQSPNVFG